MKLMFVFPYSYSTQQVNEVYLFILYSLYIYFNLKKMEKKKKKRGR